MKNQKGLREKAKETYGQFAAFYDVYVGGYAEDIPFYLDLASTCTTQILEVGCGSGRILLPLLQAGHRVTGVDISESMLALAQQKICHQGLSEKVLLINHDFVDGPLSEGLYGLALITFYTFNYLLTPEEQKSFLKHIAETLLPGATIALHLFYPSPLLHPETAGQWIFKGRFPIQKETVLLHDRRRMIHEKMEERIQAFEYPSGRTENIRTLRRWVTSAEIYDLLIACGFSSPHRIRHFSLKEQIPLDSKTVIHEDLIIIAKKP